VSTYINKKEKETKMVKYLLGAMMLVSAYLPSTIFAQQLQCGEPKEVIEELKEKFNEEPIFVMKNFQQSNIVLFINKQTKDWTLIAFNSEGTIACLVSAGTNFTLLENKNNKNL
jgi:hypothetical protein